jgi:N-acetylglucosaminyldiphosphoundecaprenol N-acetyl-beta-D-mannosaminyltransferase
MGVGGSFEMVGGVVPRAPLWLQRSGLEWLYRLVREPRRLWKRYLIGIIQFAQVVLRQRMNLQEPVPISLSSGSR